MQEFEQIKEYCNQVCDQIRWKKAKTMIALEIENHLCDQRNAYISNGDDEHSATQKAILQMGDAVLIGQELDKAHKPKPQWLLLSFVSIFMIIGATFNAHLKDSTDIYTTFSMIFYILAFGIVVLFYNIDFTLLGQHPKRIYIFILFGSIISVIFSSPISGILSFIIGPFSMPLTYLSLIFPLIFALWVYSMRNKGMIGILISGVAYLLFATILIIIPSMTGFVIYTIAAFAVLCFAISRGWYGANKKIGLLLVLLSALVMSLLFILTLKSNNPYTVNRINVFLNPELDSSGIGYIYTLIRDILSHVIFFGEGSATEVLHALPRITTDYSLVYFIHQFGFATLCGIVLLIMIFATLGICKAVKEKSVLGSTIALSIILTFILQAFSYIAANLGYGLLSPLPLPLISHGNVSLLINAALTGLMLSVFRTGEIFKDYSSVAKTGKDKYSQSIFSYKNRKLTINLNAIHFGKTFVK